MTAALHRAHSESETIALGKLFSHELVRGDVVALYGNLGAGKTRFIKGICEGLGVRDHIASPTFTIVHEYQSKSFPVYHFDFYRMTSLQEIAALGFEEYLACDGLCLIEWADRAQALLPSHRYDVRMDLEDDPLTRNISITSPARVLA